MYTPITQALKIVETQQLVPFFFFFSFLPTRTIFLPTRTLYLPTRTLFLPTRTSEKIYLLDFYICEKNKKLLI